MCFGVRSLHTLRVSDLREPAVGARRGEEGGGAVPERLEQHQPALPMRAGVLPRPPGYAKRRRPHGRTPGGTSGLLKQSLYSALVSQYLHSIKLN